MQMQSESTLGMRMTAGAGAKSGEPTRQLEMGKLVTMETVVFDMDVLL